jgi:hypothetical protein
MTAFREAGIGARGELRSGKTEEKKKKGDRIEGETKNETWRARRMEKIVWRRERERERQMGSADVIGAGRRKKHAWHTQPYLTIALHFAVRIYLFKSNKCLNHRGGTKRQPDTSTSNTTTNAVTATITASKGFTASGD